MRLWSLHPKFLDPKRLVAVWREALLAQAVLAGETRGYKHHPQLTRFLDTASPRKAIAQYLRSVHDEAVRRGYHFDAGKIGRGGAVDPLMVTRGQLAYEWAHLMRKLQLRAPQWQWQRQFAAVKLPQAHPLLRVVRGGVAAWEVVDER